MTDFQAVADPDSGTAACLAIDGLHFPDGSIIPLFWATPTMLAVGERRHLSNTEIADLVPTQLDIAFQCPAGDFLVVGGGGSWEGEGFVAALQARQLLWLLYLEESEPFTRAGVERGVVVASAGEYPAAREFHVPLLSPGWVKASVVA